jgi:DNA-binding MarR family transcriptional regulator
MRIFFNRASVVSAADVVGGVFIAQRDLLASLRSQILAGSGLTAEIAEILIELFLAEERLSLPKYADGDEYVSFRELRGALGYSPGLLSRRIAWLCERRWAETKRAAPNIAKGLHGNCQKVRITELGKGIVGPVWQRYGKLAEHLLAGISPSDLATHHRVNELISNKLRAPQTWAERRIPLARSTKASAPKSNPPGTPKKPAPPPQKYLLEPHCEFLD